MLTVHSVERFGPWLSNRNLACRGRAARMARLTNHCALRILGSPDNQYYPSLQPPGDPPQRGVVVGAGRGWGLQGVGEMVDGQTCLPNADVSNNNIPDTTIIIKWARQDNYLPFTATSATTSADQKYADKKRVKSQAF